MYKETLPVTKENLRSYINQQIQQLNSRNPLDKDITSILQLEYQSLSDLAMSKSKLTESKLEAYLNYEIDSLIEEQKAEQSQKRLSKKSKNLYYFLRKTYTDVRLKFGLKRIRNY